MRHASLLIRRLLNREAGQGVVEYLFIVSIVAIGLLSVLTSFSGYMTGPFRDSLTQNFNRVPGMK